jgi:hypothetical protein
MREGTFNIVIWNNFKWNNIKMLSLIKFKICKSLKIIFFIIEL